MVKMHKYLVQCLCKTSIYILPCTWYIIDTERETKQNKPDKNKGVNKMTRKEMIAACVDWQIERGIVKPERRAFQIKCRLKGFGMAKAMSKAECEEWYNAIFKN